MKDSVFESFPVKTSREKRSIIGLLFRHASQENFSQEDQVEMPLHEGAHILADHDPDGGRVSILRNPDGRYAYRYESTGERTLDEGLDIILAPYLQKITPLERMSKTDMHSVFEILDRGGLDHEGILNFFHKLKDLLEED